MINYADLTWPEVEQLPRDYPLLVPLGLDSLDLQSLAQHLSAEQAIVLPAIPYGFHSSKKSPLNDLAVRPGLLHRLLTGISSHLKSQGFEKIFFVSSHGKQDVNDSQLQIISWPCIQPNEFTWPEDLSARVLVISTGHTEQHGHHLPLSTDTLIVEALATQLSTLSREDVFCLPAWPYGVSTHTREFPGTLNLGGRVFEDFFLAIIDRLVTLGVQMIYFSNGHGGNHSFLVNVIKYAGERNPHTFVATEWLHTTGPELATYRQSSRGGMGHGGELETSYILHLRPDLVKMDRATREVEFISTPNYYMDWIEGGSLVANPPWTDDTLSGIYGDGTLGTAEKGKAWLEAAAKQKKEIIKEIQQQHNLRNQKRTMRYHQ